MGHIAQFRKTGDDSQSCKFKNLQKGCLKQRHMPKRGKI